MRKFVHYCWHWCWERDPKTPLPSWEAPRLLPMGAARELQGNIILQTKAVPRSHASLPATCGWWNYSSGEGWSLWGQGEVGSRTSSPSQLSCALSTQEQVFVWWERETRQPHLWWMCTLEWLSQLSFGVRAQQATKQGEGLSRGRDPIATPSTERLVSNGAGFQEGEVPV